ncbi:MAG: LysM peptidoglycan-binding domain-containing protein [Chloroflexota bacterium]|nr:LysM peptidoglycan-binding domain-containing protein [Chloroflexota bacterium]
MKQFFTTFRLPVIIIAAVLLTLLFFAVLPLRALVFAAQADAGGVRYAGEEPSNGEVTYVVRGGDTLYSIARRFNVSVTSIMQLNNISNANLIYVGQRLRIPGGSTIPAPTATPTPAAPPTATPTPASTGVWTPPANPIEVFSPAVAGIYHSPIEVIGFSQTFEGNVNLRLTDADGNVLAERNTIGGAADGFNFFHSYLRFTVTDPVSATLEVFDTSAKDGSEISKVQIALLLRPGQRFIDFNAPAVGATICNPVIVSGYSNTFEASVVVDLRQRNNTVIAQTNTQGGNLGVYRDFTASLSDPVVAPQPRLVSAYEGDPAGFGLIDQTLVPVTLAPAGSGGCP